MSSSDEEVGRLRTFLGELAAVWQERRPGEGLDLYLLGGASVILHFDLNVHTLDIDVVMPKETKDELSEVLSDFLKGGARTKGGGYFLDLVNQAFNYMPAAYRERATIAEAFGAVKVWRLDPHDLILSKIKRFAPKDKGHIRDLLERYPGKFDEYEMRRLFDTQFQFAPDIEAQCELRLQRIIGFMNGENRSLD